MLDTLLDSPVVLNQLDANTAKLWPEDKLTCKWVCVMTKCKAIVIIRLLCSFHVHEPSIWMLRNRAVPAM